MTDDFDSLFDEFEEARRRGDNRPLIEYLSDVPKSRHGVVLCDLLQIELELLIRNGALVDQKHYLKQFSEHAEAVARAFKQVEKHFPGLKAGSNTARKKNEASGPSVTVRVTKGPSKGRELTFVDHQTCTLGRAPDNHLRLSPNRSFSRYHCRLEINPPHVVVADLGSTNGTKVNGQKIETSPLCSGDEVTVGDTKFTVAIKQREPSSSVIESTITKREDDLESFDDEIPSIPGYTVERQVGHGSMGAVYLATRNSTGERVAIKIIRPMVATDKRAMEKFRREAAIILRLQHPRIVKSLDFRMTDDHLPYIVMEYIEEVDIREILQKTALKDRCRMACGIVARALEGLHYAHEMEIVHRDIKPSNLLVYRNGPKLQVKVADFGLAKNYVDAGFSDCSASNEICGTLAYMPPEQIIDCRHAKPACDIYAAGVCLYNMISGRLPYEAEMVAQQISLILNSEPKKLIELVPDVQPDLAAIVDKALNREPQERFRTAEEMRNALKPFTKRR